MKRFVMASLLALVALGALAEAPAAAQPQPAVPKEKVTSLGLYLTAPEAYDKWKADPERVKILDVRTPDEYVFVGHPSMAWNVPLVLQTYQWDSTGRKLPMKPNPDFVAQVKELFKPSDTLLVICRSGTRSAKAVDLLGAAGFKQAWSVIDGVEGDMVEDRASPSFGKRTKNGWKNGGLPWNYEIDPMKMRLPAVQQPAAVTKP
ncbi:MAG: rhodanese-like domain-containing protein [Thermoanaerobaculia bacterium]|jgi:rhodanese-related sulfurtransferase